MGAKKAEIWLRRGRGAVATALVVAYPFVAYRATVAGGHDPVGVLFAFLPILALSLAAVLGWSAGSRSLGLAVWALVCLALWRYRVPLAAHDSWAYLAEDVGMLTLLCTLFARTLRPGRIALISRLSTLVHGPLSPRLAHYTRRVTQLWAVFFGLMALTSLTLFLTAGARVWALYANALLWPLMLAVFIGEYVVRRFVIPPEERAGFLEVVVASRRYWRAVVDAERGRTPRSGHLPP